MTQAREAAEGDSGGGGEERRPDEGRDEAPAEAWAGGRGPLPALLGILAFGLVLTGLGVALAAGAARGYGVAFAFVVLPVGAVGVIVGVFGLLTAALAHIVGRKEGDHP